MMNEVCARVILSLIFIRLYVGEWINLVPYAMASPLRILRYGHKVCVDEANYKLELMLEDIE